jgi:hypothetical protein
VKRYGIRHEGHQAGPFGDAAGDRMARWRQAELDLERSRQRGDDLPQLMFRGLAHLALVRTLEGREN